MSMTTLPGCKPVSTPSSAVSTRSTSGVSGSIVMTISDARATPAGVVADVAPAATSASTAARLRL